MLLLNQRFEEGSAASGPGRQMTLRPQGKFALDARWVTRAAALRAEYFLVLPVTDRPHATNTRQGQGACRGITRTAPAGAADARPGGRCTGLPRLPEGACLAPARLLQEAT